MNVSKSNVLDRAKVILFNLNGKQRKILYLKCSTTFNLVCQQILHWVSNPQQFFGHLLFLCVQTEGASGFFFGPRNSFFVCH